MADQEYFSTLLIDNANELFQLTFDNDKEIIRDNRLDVVMEIINMLFREVNQLSSDKPVEIFDTPFDFKYVNRELDEIESENIKATKKQQETAKLFESIIPGIVGKLSNIVDVDGKSILRNKSAKKKLESVINIRFNTVSDYLQSYNYNDIIWNQALFDDIRSQIKEDIKRAQYKPAGVKGIGVCAKCAGQELIVLTKQTRASDEGSSNIYTCVSCSFRWTVKG